jgi:glycosyltransferase involved in cell wall biosynthesis
MRVVHVITGLTTGGAETMLFRLLASRSGQVQARVVVLSDVGPLAARIEALGVPVCRLGMRRGRPSARALAGLVQALAADRPDLVQTWLYHADLLGGLAARLAGGLPVAWNLRHSDLDRAGTRRTTRWTMRACARLSHWLPARIVCCSEATRRVHAALGYAAGRMEVIPNGFDLAEWRPRPEARAALRQGLGWPADAFCVGLVARLDPQKDHPTFFEAAARLAARRPGVRFVLCGDGIVPDHPALAGLLRAAGLDGRVRLLGARADVADITAGLDVAASASAWGEGFPNVLGEAMASGVPCVATDVGDARLIVGDTGRIVPPRDPEALAAAWMELHDLGEGRRRALGALARRRVSERFALPDVVRRYERLYTELGGRRRAA